jgi:phage gpG-like protein
MTLAELTMRLTGMSQSLDKVTFAPTLEKARSWIAEDTAAGFKNSVSPRGVPWAPIHHRIGKPLVDTGLMYISVISQIDQGTIAGNTLTIKVNHPFYAIFHQFGTTRIKARPWLGITDDAKRKTVLDAATEVVKQTLGMEQTT